MSDSFWISSFRLWLKLKSRQVDTVVNFSLFGEQVDCFETLPVAAIIMAQTFLAIKSVEQISQKIVL